MKYRVLKDDEIIQKGDVFTSLNNKTEYNRADVKNDLFWGITVKSAKDRWGAPCTFERPTLRTYRRLNDDEIVKKGDTIGGDDEHTPIGSGSFYIDRKAVLFNTTEPVKYFVERLVKKNKKLERCDIADVLDIISDGDGLLPESLLEDVRDMLQAILERKKHRKPSLEKLIAERDLGMKSIRISDDFSGRVLQPLGSILLRFNNLKELKTWLLEQPLKNQERSENGIPQVRTG